MLHRPSVFCLLLCAVLLAACRDDTLIDPFDAQDKYFTVFGYLEEGATEHHLRVVPLRRVPENITSGDDQNASIDAEVYTTNLTTGATHQWTHRLDTLTGNTLAHIYTGRFFVQQGDHYRLEVRRTDELTTSAETVVPVAPPTDAFAPRLGPLEGSDLLQEAVLPGMPTAWDINVVYEVIISDAGSEDPRAITRRIEIPYGRQGSKTENGDWRFTINWQADHAQMRRLADQIYDATGTEPVNRVFIEAIKLDENWDPPGGLFDPDALIIPSTLSNVVNGYGFWGSFAYYRYQVPLPAALAKTDGA